MAGPQPLCYTTAMPHKNKEARRAYERQYRAARRERFRQHSKFQDSAIHANERARVYGAQGTISAQNVRDILHPDARCYYCGKEKSLEKRMGIDHVIPLHSGGINAVENIVACCASCNSSKWRQEQPHQWARHYKVCQECGTTKSKHAAKGYCDACYQRLNKKAKTQ